MKKRELAIATQLAAAPQPTPPAPTPAPSPTQPAAAPTQPAAAQTTAAPAAPATATNDLMAALFLAAYHEVYDNQYENGSIGAFLQQ